MLLEVESGVDADPECGCGVVVPLSEVYASVFVLVPLEFHVVGYLYEDLVHLVLKLTATYIKKTPNRARGLGGLGFLHLILIPIS